MKLIKIIPITILILVLTATLASAIHTPQVLLTPSEWEANAEKELTFTVSNAKGDNIVRVELFVPLKSDQSPVYTIIDVGEPSGWLRTKYDRKIVWIAEGAGIKVGDSVNFGLIVKSPSSGQYQWNWITTDSNDYPFPGSSTTKVGLAPASYFKITGAPSSITAGNPMRITVKVYGSDNNLKTDYTGTISFVSTDSKAVVPTTYTFTSSDKGYKDFSITYKTIGTQSFTVTDLASKISQRSISTSVELGRLSSLVITPDNSQVNAGKSIVFKAEAKDEFENKKDVTNSTKWSIDQEAGGIWNSNIYTAQKEGTWTVIGVYNSLADGTALSVKPGTVVIPPAENETKPQQNETKPLEEMSIETQDSVEISPGSNETFVVTVKNTGSEDLADVSLSSTDVPSDWITAYPSKTTISVGASKDFLVVLAVPNETNQTFEKNISLVASSSSGTKATKNIALTIASAPTGLMGLSKNLLNLGIVIVAVAALVLIAWELWFRKK
ncbi:hypothetical protein A3K64_02920 [Candidatus Micrarchaeota archaeon RBG_16_36_9]|nr:MAG: hypothetical protein A3K64_02920 [Candidatus Micrarchaeota archaeon RBG_16_36_9]